LSKLLNLQEWVTCDYAARFLTDRLKEEVSKSDVLGLALHGRLTLSVFLPNPSWALHGNLVEVGDLSEHFPPDSYTEVEEGDPFYDYEHNIRARRWNLYQQWGSDKDTLIVDGTRNQVLEIKSWTEIRGVWDLTMRGGERNYVYGLSIGKKTRAIRRQGVLVVKDRKEEGDLAYALLPDPPFTGFFPKESRLVVRSAALQKLEARPEGVNAKKENADLRKRIEAVLTYARNRKFPKETSQSRMAEHIFDQRKNQGFKISALKQILSGRYKPMRRLGLDGLN
jgi:hypothetical protein